ncbi:RNA polymerase sigma-70 factor, ECF subfamily [Pelagibacterium luteolum]|uniref:RNA polymerase sigma-70 factor, ECF subfamily n=2 Tax=Pelagibacterium luteolum TaxID=440168 RepID=A0A1G7TPX6_9HYPH|nr:RNA polymerase sigma-70 factor, ECF subfamily [Pelagibacterium luteolum]
MVALLPRLRAFARSLTRNAADADDLVQQTCEKALAGLSGFTPGTKLESWLFRIMHNQWIDVTRRRRPTLDIESEGLAETLTGEDGRLTTQARMEWRAVSAAMADLPPDQSGVLMLVCVEGLRYREVADILDIPIGTVMSRLARARTAVADALDGKSTAAPASGEHAR